MAAVAVVGLSQPAVANVFSTFSDRDSDREINNFVANLQMPEALPGIAMEESAGFQSEKASMTETGSTEIANEKSSESMPMPQNANEDMATEKQPQSLLMIPPIRQPKTNLLKETGLSL